MLQLTTSSVRLNCVISAEDQLATGQFIKTNSSKKYYKCIMKYMENDSFESAAEFCSNVKPFADTSVLLTVCMLKEKFGELSLMIL